MRGARTDRPRARPTFKLERSPLAKRPRVRVEPFAIPPDIFELEAECRCRRPKLPMGDRMQAEVQLAYLDYAHSRFEPATARFRKALAFFQWAGMPAMEGLIISGLGDIERRKANWKQAQHWYACATVPAAEAGSPILLANIVQNLALVAYQENRFADAEERYESSSRSSAACSTRSAWRSPSSGRASAKKNNKPTTGRSKAGKAALVCKTFELKDHLKSMLAHLRRGYEKLEMREELRNFDVIWKA